MVNVVPSSRGLCDSDLTVVVAAAAIVAGAAGAAVFVAGVSLSQNCVCVKSAWCARWFVGGSVGVDDAESVPSRPWINGCAVGPLSLVRFRPNALPLAMVVVVAVWPEPAVAVVAANPIFVLWPAAKFSPSYVCCTEWCGECNWSECACKWFGFPANAVSDDDDVDDCA